MHEHGYEFSTITDNMQNLLFVLKSENNRLRTYTMQLFTHFSLYSPLNRTRRSAPRTRNASTTRPTGNRNAALPGWPFARLRRPEMRKGHVFRWWAIPRSPRSQSVLRVWSTCLIILRWILLDRMCSERRRNSTRVSYEFVHVLKLNKKQHLKHFLTIFYAYKCVVTGQLIHK